MKRIFAYSVGAVLTLLQCHCAKQSIGSISQEGPSKVYIFQKDLSIPDDGHCVGVVLSEEEKEFPIFLTRETMITGYYSQYLKRNIIEANGVCLQNWVKGDVRQLGNGWEVVVLNNIGPFFAVEFSHNPPGYVTKIGRQP